MTKPASDHPASRTFLGVPVWSVLVTPPLSGAENMAIDEALMHRAAERQEGVFRVYQWSAPTLSIGRHQRARDALTPCAPPTRRPTRQAATLGGRALLTGAR
ncbi:MAG: hypothetical protein U0163_15560 [Gemmatimonadaceae bacterium]